MQLSTLIIALDVVFNTNSPNTVFWVSRMVDIQTVSIAVASAGVLIAAIYYVLLIRHQTKIRQTDLIMRLYSIFSSGEFQDAWDKLRDIDFEQVTDIYEYGRKHGGLKEVNQVCLFFEGVGILLQRGLVDIRMVDDLFHGAITREWEKLRTTTRRAREQLKDPELYYYFEYLYNELKKREQKLQQSKD